LHNSTLKPWFVLVRHDEPEPEPAPESEPSDTDPPKPGEEPEEKPKPEKPSTEAELAKWKALARKHEANSKANAKAAEKLAAIEDEQKTEAEKLVAAKDAAEARAAAALSRAVAAEIKVLASVDFADPTDAESAIKAADYVDDKGDIDTEGIKTRLAELLEAKPHWRKAPAEPPKPKAPKPDPGQGARGKPAELDYRKASKEDFAAALAEFRLSPRT